MVLSPVWIWHSNKIYYWVTVLLKNIVRFLLKHHLAFRITYKSKIVCLGVKCLRKMIFFIRDLTMVKFLLNPSEWNTKRRKSYAQVKKKTGSCPYKTLHGGTNYECVPFCDQLTPTEALCYTNLKRENWSIIISKSCNSVYNISLNWWSLSNLVIYAWISKLKTYRKFFTVKNSKCLPMIGQWYDHSSKIQFYWKFHTAQRCRKSFTIIQTVFLRRWWEIQFLARWLFGQIFFSNWT